MKLNIYDDIIYPALDEIRDTVDNPELLVNSPETSLYGDDAVLDSLGLVSLIVSIEERIEDETGLSLTLADEKAMSRKNSPFISVNTLADYLNELLEGQK